jgi:hypothetical protein
MKVYFINSKKKNCGVYQYGLRIWDSIKDSNLDIQYFEIENIEDFNKLDFNGIDIIFFNWIEGGSEGPFGWYNYTVALELKAKYNITTVTVMHTPDFSSTVFDYYIDQNTVNSGFIRPLYNYDISKLKPKNDIINIGSFGFAGDHKGFDDIVMMVNNQYNEAQINLHITNAYYGDAKGTNQHKIIDKIKAIERKPGIKLNITSDFLTNEEVLDFVYKNDIIILGYKGVRDISSLPDYAISTNTPLGVTNVGSFNHVYKEDIDISLHTIDEILNFNLKNDYVGSLRKEWSRENMISCFENLMKIIYDAIELKSYSQVCQDQFALKLIGNNGYFLDLGAGWDPSLVNSNTLLLEENGWNGVCIEGNPESAQRRRNAAIRAEVLCVYVPQTTISEILKSVNAPKVIDYVSLDIEPMTIIGLENFPFDEYEFKVLTFEHDFYVHGPKQKDDAHEILTKQGYIRLCNNVNIPEEGGLGLYFEDWYINPKYFSKEFVEQNTFSEILGPSVIKKLKFV